MLHQKVAESENLHDHTINAMADEAHQKMKKLNFPLHKSMLEI